MDGHRDTDDEPSARRLFGAAVRLGVLDAAGSVPRNPQGYRVSVADFDMSVASPDGKSFVGKEDRREHWSACACQAATVGTVGTITATYPASMLAVASRVRGVNVSSTATFTTAAAKGPGNPVGCAIPGASTSAQVGAPLMQPPPTRAPVQPAAPTPIDPGTSVPPTGRVAAPAPAPTGVTATGTPNSATLEWSPVPGVASYVVLRQGPNRRSRPADSRPNQPRCVRRRPPAGYDLLVHHPRHPVRWSRGVSRADLHHAGRQESGWVHGQGPR